MHQDIDVPHESSSYVAKEALRQIQALQRQERNRGIPHLFTDIRQQLQAGFASLQLLPVAFRKNLARLWWYGSGKGSPVNQGMDVTGHAPPGHERAKTGYVVSIILENPSGVFRIALNEAAHQVDRKPVWRKGLGVADRHFQADATLASAAVEWTSRS